MAFKDWIISKNLSQKLNPSQATIAGNIGTSFSVQPQRTYIWYYQNIQIVNRAINMVVDDVSQIRMNVGQSLGIIKASRFPSKKVQIEKLLNYQPNPFQDRNSFFRSMVLDLLLNGNAFVYFDGAHIYNLPARDMVVVPDQKTYIKQFQFKGGQQIYSPQQIIHIKDNNHRTSYRGVSRLRSALRTMKVLKSMRDFQDNFFANGAVTGLVIQVPDTLSQRMKEKMAQQWKDRYKPTTGGKSPAILDGGKKINPVSDQKFKDLDFQQGIKANEQTILKSIGIPPILMDSGNNANIRPNHRIYYLQTISPIIQKINSAMQSFFGFQVTKDVSAIPALQPQLRDEAAYYTTLVNGGVISANQARMGLGKQKMQGHDQLRIPANIAGSAANPSQGGRPNNEQ